MEPTNEKTWHPVATVYEIPRGTAHVVEIEGTEIAIFHTKDGRFHALQDLCTHADAALSEGLIEGNTVYCPWHGAPFDLCTGKALGPPAYEPVPRYELRLRDEWVDIAWPPTHS